MFILNQQNSIANQYLAELRQLKVQDDRMRFRKNLERLGEIMAYEISRKLAYAPLEVESPLATITTEVPAEQPVLLTILRAGVPFYNGFSNFFDKADTGFIGAYRAPHTSAKDLTVAMDYASVPPIEGRPLIIIDPMLATGKSMLMALELLLQQGKPSHIYVASVIAAPEGVTYLQRNLQANFSIWTCALDDRLDERAYIVPGLGDAGDLAYGPKI
ncbi:uracil phosphoribosyltransferase [Nafulsella turpanensis]|uniref:uracil phosphoribosyltransferase n=1 Tax=Nafulsella turpanensis TaxID=1265690 RepID=UPI000347EAFD|nr:uracil phosphoribosyltransferase [Nafulsella turpanensis]